MFIKKISTSLIFIILALCGQCAHAGVIVGATRVIYNGGHKETFLSVKNPDKYPYLIQAWSDAAGVKGDDKSAPKSPFLVTPPVFRLDPGNENMLRIIRTGGNLPEDRESVYWMDIKSIPATVKGDKNVLQISVKTRIKLFYRPEKVGEPTMDDYKKLQFRKNGGNIHVDNPTPYYITFYSMNISGANIDTSNIMVPPKGSAEYKTTPSSSGNTVSWKIINDYGGSSEQINSPLL
ncbi:molecular chaperone [Enterobacter asburiae]|nr:molecular chaperone [Enterobacter asburiae]